LINLSKYNVLITLKYLEEEDKKKKIEKIRTPIIEELDRVHGLKRNTNF
jgi:hypothetical protein